MKFEFDKKELEVVANSGKIGVFIEKATKLLKAKLVKGQSGQIKQTGCPKMQKGADLGGGKTIHEGEIVDFRGVYGSFFSAQ